MGLYKNISSGDNIDFSARRQNDLSALLNKFADEGGGVSPTENSVTLSVYSQDDIPAYAPVMLNGNALHSETKDLQQMLFEVSVAKEDEDKPWGILNDRLVGKQNFVSATFAGATLANVKVSSSDDTFVKLEGNNLVTTNEGEVKILWKEPSKAKDCLALILLGGGSGGSGYTGNFAVTWEGGDQLNISSGYLNCNGFIYKSIGAQSINLDSGTLCIQSRPATGKDWTEPAYVFTSPSKTAFPIAEISIDKNDAGEKKVTIRQFPVVVAFLLYSTRCRLADY